MSEEILERLSRFTPDAGGLSRDAVLFAAGRSSARPGRAWAATASFLATTQVLSLVLLWPHSTSPSAGGSAVVVAPVPGPTEPPDRSIADTSAQAGSWPVGRSLRESDLETRPAGDVTFIDHGPPLRAFAPLPASLVN